MTCEHNWQWHYDCFEDARILDGDMLGIPVQCTECKTTGIEWYAFSKTETEKLEEE